MGGDSRPIDPEQLGRAYARAFAEDLSGLIGAAVRLNGPAVEELDRAGLPGGVQRIAITTCRSKDESEELKKQLEEAGASVEIK